MRKPEGPTIRHSHAKSWSDDWTLVRSLESGNQGLSIEAIDADGRRAFIKVQPACTSSERRERFCREVRILGGLDVFGIPRLLESNVAQFKDSSYELFFATEFIDGRRLTDVVSSGLSAIAAVELSLKIVRIVKAAHEADVVHRDIKPDNVVIRLDGLSLAPFLVDFGMGYVDDTPGDFATNRNQEVGNRFLRLPEYSSGFANKHDQRSDYTFCVGLFFFMLTKTKPAVLLDEENRAPHVRHLERIVLRETPLDPDRLLRLFDVGFQYDLTKRFQTANDLIAALEHLLIESRDEAPDAEAIANRLRERFVTATRRSHADAAAAAGALTREVDGMLKSIVGYSGGVLTLGSYDVRSFPGQFSSNFFVSDPADSLKKYEPVLTIENAGAEQILTLRDNLEGTTETRVLIGEDLEDDQRECLRVFLLTGIDRATSDDRFYTPRKLELSTHFPGNAPGPGDEIAGPDIPIDSRPVLEISWFPPRNVDGRLMLSWEIRNVGGDLARDVCIFLANVSSYREGEMSAGSMHSNERRFAELKAYHDFMKVANVVVEYCDERGYIYRQMGDVSAIPAYKGGNADYRTTRLGHAYRVANRIVKPD